jgi:hypothetical protein
MTRAQRPKPARVPFLPWQQAFEKFWKARVLYCTPPRTPKNLAECAYLNGYLAGSEWAVREVRSAKKGAKR